MSGERARRRAFRPTLDERLESRLALSHGTVAVAATAAGTQQGFDRVQLANGGRAAIVHDVDGDLWQINLQGGGTLKAIPRRGGLLDIVVRGSTQQSELTFNPRAVSFQAGTAHQTIPGFTGGDGLLHIGSVTVRSGKIGSILGFRTADLSGTLTVGDAAAPSTDATVDRIAFYAINPGASINVGGDLNTLDVLQTLQLGDGGTITIGRDLNLLNAGGSVAVAAGSAIVVQRDLGLTAQGAKGSGLGGRGAVIVGDLVVLPGGLFVVNRFVDASIFVEGSAVGTNQLSPNIFTAGGTNNPLFAIGGTTP